MELSLEAAKFGNQYEKIYVNFPHLQCKDVGKGSGVKPFTRKGFLLYKEVSE